MSKLSLNLTKINKNQPKLAVKRFLCGAEYSTGEKGWERKRDGFL